MSCATQKSLAAGHIVSFQIHPKRFIAFFYTGLGASLLLAGLLFGCNFGKAAKAAAKSNE